MQPIISRVGQPLNAFETNLSDHVNQMKNLMDAPERNLKVCPGHRSDLIILEVNIIRKFNFYEINIFIQRKVSQSKEIEKVSKIIVRTELSVKRRLLLDR
jgi:hypothetical protein